MSLDELELILCDMYEMDEWLPNPVFDKNGFAKTSNTLWAIGEFRNYVANHIYPPNQNVYKKSGSNGTIVYRENGRLCFYESTEQFYIYCR